MMRTIGLAVMAYGILVAGAARVARTEPTELMTPWRWQRSEVEKRLSGLSGVELEGWGQLLPKVYQVSAKLVSYSRTVIPVIPARSLPVEQAHLGGWIVLDLATAGRPEHELAYWLAHEWGHETLGHPANLYRPAGKSWRTRATSTAHEDAADRYAGEFLCSAGYEVEKVIAALKWAARVHGDKAHGNADQRGRQILAGYVAGGCSPPGVVPRRQCTSRLVECKHPAHPAGDQVPCQHPKHPAGDVVPCTHACRGPLGVIPCHRSDTVPCTHMKHAFDLKTCTHPRHPGGDRVRDCN